MIIRVGNTLHGTAQEPEVLGDQKMKEFYQWVGSDYYIFELGKYAVMIRKKQQAKWLFTCLLFALLVILITQILTHA